MNYVNARNVHQALVEGCRSMELLGVLRDSRNGEVKVLPSPLVTAYTNPTEKVLFHPSRDANPFFHLMEVVWMFAGRNDVQWISTFNSNIGSYSDDGETFHGAYGHRWRAHFGIDQIRKIGEVLRENPDCRRQVLGMWDPQVDLARDGKDVPCNVMATFQVDQFGSVEMTVFNRSNDLIWGAYGANAVHFAALLELVAAIAGRPVGRYYQVSANTHVYSRHFDLVRDLAALAPMPPERRTCPYSKGPIFSTPLFPFGVNLDELDFDLSNFFARAGRPYGHPIFDVFEAVREAWEIWKEFRDPVRAKARLEALPERSDWRVACEQWIDRRASR